MTQQNQDNSSVFASVKRDARRRRKKLEELESRMEERILEMKEHTLRMKEEQDQNTRNIQFTLAFTFFVVIASHFLFYPSLTMKNMNTKMETTKLKEEAVSDPDILTAIVGSWKIVSSDGMDQYVLRMKSEWTFEPLEEESFRSGIHHFEFDNNTQTMTTFESVRTQIYDKKQFKLGEPKKEACYSVTTFVDANQLVVTAESPLRGQYYRGERFVKDGKLHLVSKRWGMTCTRIYEKLSHEESERLKERLEEPGKELEKEPEETESEIEKQFNRLFNAIERFVRMFVRDLKKLANALIRFVNSLKLVPEN